MPHIAPKDGWPSVTQIPGLLDKPYLYRWYAKHGWDKCEQLKEESAEAGRKFHGEVEAVLRDHFSENSLGHPLNPFTEAIVRWCEVVGFVPNSYEQYVESKIYKYGGTYDCVGHLPKDRLTLIDWKKTGQLSDTYAIQAAGYYQAYLETHDEEIQEARIVRVYEQVFPAKADSIKIGKQSTRYSFKGLNVKIEERVYTNLNHYFGVFKNLREVWDFVHNKGMWEK